jgi:hypothetical protein
MKEIEEYVKEFVERELMFVKAQTQGLLSDRINSLESRMIAPLKARLEEVAETVQEHPQQITSLLDAVAKVKNHAELLQEVQ